jgi:acyl carrier protein
MDIKDVVVESCKKVIKENDENINVTEETEISIGNGIDSLGIVTIIFEIEEQLEIELDEYLSHIRRCKTIGDLIGVVEKASEKS